MNYLKLHKYLDNSELIVDPDKIIGFTQDDRTFIVTISTMDGLYKVKEPLYEIDILYEKITKGENYGNNTPND